MYLEKLVCEEQENLSLLYDVFPLCMSFEI